MRPCNVLNQNYLSGFTLLESLVVVAIAGSLAAISIPSLMAMYDQQKLRNAVEMVVAALQESQQQSIARNHRCVVTFDTNQSKVLGQVQGSCLLTGDRSLPPGIGLTINGQNSAITYGMKGNTTNNRMILINLLGSNAAPKCVVVSAPIGILRFGNYDPNLQLCKSNL